jgi:hypothetical protein
MPTLARTPLYNESRRGRGAVPNKDFGWEKTMKVLNGFLVTLLIAVFPLAAKAAILNWYDDVDYAAGSLNQTFTNIDGSGIDITFAWSGNTNRLLANFPDDDTAKTQFNLSGLWYAANFAAYPSESVSVVITFSQPVTNVSFNVYAIDGLIADTEKTRIKAFLNNVATLPNNYGSGNNVRTQIVPIGSTDDGLTFWNKTSGSTPLDPANQGWVTFNGPIDKIGLQFKAAAGGDRGQFLGDISFAPEPATIAVLGLGSVLLLRKKW